MKFLGVLLVLIFASINSFAVSIDCVTTELKSFRLDFSPEDSSALYIELPQKDNIAPISMMPISTDDETDVVFLGQTKERAWAVLFKLDAFSEAMQSGRMEGVFLYSTNKKKDLEHQVAMTCKKN